MKKLMVIVVALLCLGSCTQQQRARQFGGTATEDLKPGLKLVMITWKDEHDLWILTRPMRPEEQAETYSFKQSSAWGLVSGEVVIHEHKP